MHAFAGSFPNTVDVLLSKILISFVFRKYISINGCHIVGTHGISIGYTSFQNERSITDRNPVDSNDVDVSVIFKTLSWLNF